MKISQSSNKMYSNKILNFEESTTSLNACKKKSGNLLKAPRLFLSLSIYIYADTCIVIHQQTISLYNNSSVWLDK